MKPNAFESVVNWPEGWRCQNMQPPGIMVNAKLSANVMERLVRAELLILPEKEAGPDMIFRLPLHHSSVSVGSPSMVLMSLALKSTEKRAVEAGESRKNIKTSDMRNIYTKENGEVYVVYKGTGKSKQIDKTKTHEFATRRKEILAWVKNSQAVTVSVRVEIPKCPRRNAWPLGFSWEEKNTRGRVMITAQNMEVVFGEVFASEWKRKYFM
jgi:hypothetical protein